MSSRESSQRPAFVDYALPPELIAQSPAEPRDASRMLLVRRRDRSISNHRFSELPDILGAGDLVVFNDSRVIPARLVLRRRSGGRVEILLLEELGDGVWEAMARPLGRLQPGEMLDIARSDEKSQPQSIEFLRRTGNLAHVRIEDPRLITQHGQLPLPPYITQASSEGDRYQTVYATSEGSAAAPTAGLHFTPELMERLESRDIELRMLTLHVGIDTFKPFDDREPDNHQMHSEWFSVPESTWRAVEVARSNNRRIVSVGSTTTRVLESIALQEAKKPQLTGRTSIFVRPGFEFQVVGAQITNFHLPKTTLLMMMSAFAGSDLLERAYEHAIRERYRFYSFGDAMLIV